MHNISICVVTCQKKVYLSLSQFYFHVTILRTERTLNKILCAHQPSNKPTFLLAPLMPSSQQILHYFATVLLQFVVCETNRLLICTLHHRALSLKVYKISIYFSILSLAEIGFYLQVKLNLDSFPT